MYCATWARHSSSECGWVVGVIGLLSQLSYLEAGALFALCACSLFSVLKSQGSNCKRYEVKICSHVIVFCNIPHSTAQNKSTIWRAGKITFDFEAHLGPTPTITTNLDLDGFGEYL